MLYVLFLFLAVIYNLRKFGKERGAIVSSIIEAKNDSHRQMILSHHFYIFIFECFISFIVAHFISERAMAIGIISLGMVYLLLLFLGFYSYQIFIKHLEKHTQLSLWLPFRDHILKEIRVNFALVMLPILIYSLMNMTFQDGIYEEWGSFWVIGLMFNIIFVSVLTIVCSVIIMLKLIPNREITEPEYLEIINKRRMQIGMPELRVRWIETDVKNAFVAGLKLFRFSNQTMFIGKSLRTMLTMEEFDAVISHELSHVANRHIHKRVLDLLKNFFSVMVGTGFIMVAVMGLTFLYWGEDASIHSSSTAFIAVSATLLWIVFNFALLFDTIRSHEFEADAFAVMKLGASFDALKTALDKLMTPDELPDYLKLRSRPQTKKGALARFFGRYFTTHPDHASRISSLQHKIHFNLPYDHYLSSAQKISSHLSTLLKWKVLVPGMAMLLVTVVWMGVNFKQGQKTITYLQEATSEEVRQNKTLLVSINQRPTLLGPSLMYYIVKKGDQSLIDHFIDHGAEKGRTLIYLAQQKDLPLFNHYYQKFQQGLSDEEYFLILRKSAQVNFTDGYRLLVNAKRFEGLDSSYKQDLATVHKTSLPQRVPASVKK